MSAGKALTAGLFTALLLAGCASHTTLQGGSPVSWEQQKAEREMLSRWTLNGKMAIRKENKASSFSVRWQQDEDNFSIRLAGPLGQGAVSITGKDRGPVVLQSAQGVQTARSLKQLAHRNTQIDLPLESLKYWVRAIPDPSRNADIVMNTRNQLVSIHQNGWTVQYQNFYEDSGLPRKIEFRQDQKSGKMVIRRWELEQ